MERRVYPVPSVIPDAFQTILHILEGEKCQFSWTIRKNLEKFSLSVAMSPAKIDPPHKKGASSSGKPLRRNSCPVDEENSAKVKKSKKKSPSAKARDRKGHRESKKISNDQELIQSDPISCPQNQKGNN